MNKMNKNLFHFSDNIVGETVGTTARESNKLF